MKHRTIFVLLGILASIVLLALILLPRPSVESVADDFLHNDSNRAEDMSMDPLILHADLVKDRVIEEVKNPKMPKRRYAISFLGVARVTNALPVLRTILSDNSEVDYFRADALVSIYQISRKEGLVLAEQCKDQANQLGSIARGLVDGTHRPFERTLADAKAGRHE